MFPALESELANPNTSVMWKSMGIFLYLSILVYIGILASRRMKDIRDYYAAGKGLGFWSTAFSARATGESAWLLIGLTGMGAALGVKAFWVVIGEVLGVAGAWLLLSRRFKRLTDQYDSITVPDYLESRFRDSTHVIRLVSAVALVIFVTCYVSAQIDATGQAFESFLNWNYFAGALLGFAVVMAYITTGGFLAVAWSDVFQGALMFIGLVALPIVGLISIGGFGPLADKLGQVDLNGDGQLGDMLSWTAGEPLSAMTIAGIISLVLIGLGFLGSPQIFVRFIAMRSEDEIPKGTAVALVWTLLADSGAVLIGMVGRHLVGSEGETVLADTVAHLMPSFVVGLYIAIVLAAIMSTADSLLVVASSAAVRDVYQKVMRPDLSDKALMKMSRIATVIIGLLALSVAMTVAIVTEERSVFWFVIFGWSGIAATFCPTLILSIFWSGITRTGAICAMVTGFLCVPLFKFWIPGWIGGETGAVVAELGELPPAFFLSLLAGIIVSLLNKSGTEGLEGVHSDLEKARA